MPAAAVWLPPVDHYAGKWRLTLFTQVQAGRKVVVGAVLLSAEPGEGGVGEPLTEDAAKALWPLIDAHQAVPTDPDAKLKLVAEVYEAVLAGGQRPVKAVEAAFDVAHGTAGNLVWRARKKGFLKETTPGRAA